VGARWGPLPRSNVNNPATLRAPFAAGRRSSGSRSASLRPRPIPPRNPRSRATAAFKDLEITDRCSRYRLPAPPPRPALESQAASARRASPRSTPARVGLQIAAPRGPPHAFRNTLGHGVRRGPAWLECRGSRTDVYKPSASEAGAFRPYGGPHGHLHRGRWYAGSPALCDRGGPWARGRPTKPLSRSSPTSAPRWSRATSRAGPLTAQGLVAYGGDHDRSTINSSRSASPPSRGPRRRRPRPAASSSASTRRPLIVLGRPARLRAAHEREDQ